MTDRKAYKKQWDKDHKEHMKEYWKKYYRDHIKDRKSYEKQRYIDNKEEIKAKVKEWYVNNKDHVKAYKKQLYIDKKKTYQGVSKEYYKNNCGRMKKHSSEYYKTHKKEYNEYSRINNQKRRKINIKYSINCRVTNAIWKSLKSGKKAGRHWEDLVGYTVGDLIKRLKKTMPKGYDWQDYLDGKLHIDHIIPISVFNFNQIGQVDFQRCWALSNLRLLPAKENLCKHNKLDKPFQPALQF